MTIRETFPYAMCSDCGWRGFQSQLIEGDDCLEECCPECGSSYTEWLRTLDEFEGED